MIQKTLYSFILFILFFFTAKSQMTMHTLVHAGYVYQNQSFGELGCRLLFLKKDDVIFRVGSSAVMGAANGKFAIMPKIQGDILLNFEKNVDFYHSYYFLLGAEATTKYVAPKIGFSFFGIVDLTGGYGISIDKNGLNGKELHGFNFNFTVNIPTVAIHDFFSK